MSNDKGCILLDKSILVAFLDDFEAVSDVAPPSTEFATSTPTQCEGINIWPDNATSVEKESIEKKTWRQRRKEEVLHLRQLVKELSVELERLKMISGVQSTLPNVMKSTPKFVTKATTVHNTELSLIWEKMADRQSTLRLRSEKENIRLREMVTKQLYQAKKMHRAYKRKLREDMLLSAVNFIQQNRLNTRGIAPPLDNEEIFGFLTTGLDGLYHGADSFFEDVGMNQLSCPGRKVKSTLNGGVFFEFHDNYALPFDIWRTAKAVWDPEQDRSGKPILHFSLNFTTNSDTKMRMLGFAFCIKSVEYRVVMRSVTRRYFEDGRIVFISKNLIQPVIKGISFAFLATRRMILKSGDWSALGPTTVMQTHRDAAVYGNLTSMDTIENPVVKAGVEDWKNSLLLFNNKVEDQLIHAVNKAATPM